MSRLCILFSAQLVILLIFNRHNHKGKRRGSPIALTNLIFNISLAPILFGGGVKNVKHAELSSLEPDPASSSEMGGFGLDSS